MKCSFALAWYVSVYISHLSTSLFWQHSQPVAYHSEDGGKVGKTKHYPQPNQRFEEEPAIKTTTWTQKAGLNEMGSTPDPSRDSPGLIHSSRAGKLTEIHLYPHERSTEYASFRMLFQIDHHFQKIKFQTTTQNFMQYYFCTDLFVRFQKMCPSKPTELQLLIPLKNTFPGMQCSTLQQKQKNRR